MQHEAAPTTGALHRARFLTSIPPLARSIGLSFLLLSAPSMALAQSAVSVAASDGTASEMPADNGEFVVSLAGGNEADTAVTVQYSVAGSATPSIDYVALSGVATIPAGANSTAVVVTPLDDDLNEGEETVELTLTGTDSPAAPVGTPATASLVILDDESNSGEGGNGDDGDGGDGDNGDGGGGDGDGDDGNEGGGNDGDCDDGNEGGGNDGDCDDGDGGDGDDGNGGDGNDGDGGDGDDGDGDDGGNDDDDGGDGGGDGGAGGGGAAADPDADGLTNAREEELGTDPAAADTDGDGVGDGDEDAAGTDPLDQQSFADTDGDLVPDAVEAADGTDPNNAISFADGDSGGTADHIETISYPSFGISATNIADASDDRRDFDGDGLPDRLEISIAADPASEDSPTSNGAGDENGNGVSNAVDAYLATLQIATADAVSDRDRDGYPDVAEVELGLDPLSATERDTDSDGVPDVVEVLAGADIDGATDTDGDGVPDAREIAMGTDTLDANSPIANGAMDDDGDGVSNGIEEVLQLLGAENIDASSDGDGDGIVDADEIRFGTDPFHDEQPTAWIELTQADIGPVNALVSDGGAVTATAVVGGHQTGTLLYDWSESDNAILAVSSGGQSNRTLAIEPQTLPPGPYNLVLSVERRVGDYSSPVSKVEFTVSVLADAGAAEIADADNDGVPDAVDDADAHSGFGNELQVQSGARMQTEPGIRLQLGSTARTARTNSALVTTEDIANAGDGSGGSVGNSEDEFDYVSGIFDFEVTNLPEVGSTVRVVIPQAMAIGEFPEYRKFQPESGWGNFVENDNNSIASAPGSSGACPAPGDDSYQPGLTPGHSCIQLTIEDGGPNDADAALGPNGVIKDPSGVATAKGQVSVGQGSGSVSLGALFVFGFIALLAGIVRRMEP